MLNNWQYRILAVLLAVMCWYVITGREKVDAWFEIPVELTNTQRNIYISEGLLTRVNVRIRGPKSMVRGLEPKNLAYPLDLSGLKPGENSITLKPENVPVSSALEIMEINPARINLKVEKLVEKNVPVEVEWQAPLDQDYELRRKSVQPPEVRLRGPESVVSMLEKIPTATVNVNATKPGVINTDIGLVLSESVEARPSEVDVTLVFGLKHEDIWIRIPVAVNAPEGITAESRPETVELKVNAPINLARDDKVKEFVKAEVSIAPDTPAVNDVFPYDLKLPEGVSLIKAVPERVEIIFKKN